MSSLNLKRILPNPSPGPLRSGEALVRPGPDSLSFAQRIRPSLLIRARFTLAKGIASQQREAKQLLDFVNKLENQRLSNYTVW